MRLRIKSIFKSLLIGYISKGNTVTESSQEEVERLTDKFIKNLDDDECFTERAVESYCWYMDENLSDEFRSLYSLSFDNYYYTKILEDYIKFILHDRENCNRRLRIESSDESDENGI